MGFEKGNKKGKKFVKGEVTNPNGRPKKLVSTILAQLQEEGELVTKSLVEQTYQVLMSLTQEQLVRIGSDKEQPMINRIIAKEMLGKKGFEIIEKMMDRANGRPMQTSEVRQENINETVRVVFNSIPINLPTSESEFNIDD